MAETETKTVPTFPDNLIERVDHAMVDVETLLGMQAEARARIAELEARVIELELENDRLTLDLEQANDS